MMRAIDQRARTRLVERDALALQVGDDLDAHALCDDMHAFGIEIGDEAQPLDLGLALVDAGAGVGPGGHVGLARSPTPSRRRRCR